MTNHRIYYQLNQLLQKLQRQLQTAGCWSEQTPSAEALSSKAPFACDTLLFEEWLQFIFIPKMTILIRETLPLPTEIGLLPMAEVQLQPNADFSGLLSTIADIDNVISEYNS